VTNTWTLEAAEADIEATFQRERDEEAREAAEITALKEVTEAIKAQCRKERLGLIWRARVHFVNDNLSPRAKERDGQVAKWLTWASDKWGVSRAEAFRGEDIEKANEINRERMARERLVSHNSKCETSELTPLDFERQDQKKWKAEQEATKAALPPKPQLATAPQKPTLSALEKVWDMVLGLSPADQKEIRDYLIALWGDK